MQARVILGREKPIISEKGMETIGDRAEYRFITGLSSLQCAELLGLSLQRTIQFLQDGRIKSRRTKRGYDVFVKDLIKFAALTRSPGRKK